MDPAQPSFTANVAPLESKDSLSWKKWGLILGVGILAIVFWTWINSPLVVTVTGTGEVSVPATNATLSFTLSANDNSTQGAVNSVTAKAESMRAFLMTKGVAEGDIAQSQVAVVPASLVTQGAGGFQATVSMAAKTTHVSDVANLVSDLYTNGATVVTQPVLSVENIDTIDQDAFRSALKDAKSQAGKIGLINWKFIRKIASISQTTFSSTSTATTRADALTQANNTLAATNGVFKIVKTVSVSYKMW